MGEEGAEGEEGTGSFWRPQNSLGLPEVTPATGTRHWGLREAPTPRNLLPKVQLLSYQMLCALGVTCPVSLENVDIAT